MRGGLGYAVMMVLNPIIILFYQNCSFVPQTADRAIAKRPAPVATTQVVTKAQRTPASADIAANTKECQGRADCPTRSE
jgi:hypothetical protein